MFFRALFDKIKATANGLVKTIDDFVEGNKIAEEVGAAIESVQEKLEENIKAEETKNENK